MNSQEQSIFGIVITMVIVGSLVLIVMIPAHPVKMYGCGEGTFYHNKTNSCEKYPEVVEKSVKLSESLLSLLEKTNDKGIKFDERGYAKGKCPVMNGSNWSMDSDCMITLKQQ